MALANHSHLAPTLKTGYSHTCTSLSTHRNQREQYKTKTEPCQLNTSKTVLMIHYRHWNGRSRNISHQYIRYYREWTI